RGATGAILAAVGLFVAAAIHFSVTGQSLDQAIGGAGPTVVLIGIVVAAGAAVPNIARWSRRRRTASR
ncbi:MAG TPA: hypothetical protein VG248_02950, partial [Caulobacteraceae bacterium]|nr:hypothetical protein [Caulobacteraceae bacterium]